MPVYNEEECIVGVVNDWRSALSGLNIDFKMIVLNDGSKDNTAQALEAFADYPRVEVINKTNSGHGPTILRGYHQAVDSAEWVFQCDSDDEMKPDSFAALWEKRNRFDALFGVRKERRQNISRKFISFCSRFTVNLLFGKSIADVNTPYRLLRANYLKVIINQIPAETFAPNIIISGAFTRAGLRVYEHEVPHENRKTGQASIVKWNLWKSAVKAFGQTLSCRPEINKI